MPDLYCGFDVRSLKGRRISRLPHGERAQTVVSNGGDSYWVCDLCALHCFDCGEAAEMLTVVGREALCGLCLAERFYFPNKEVTH